MHFKHILKHFKYTFTCCRKRRSKRGWNFKSKVKKSYFSFFKENFKVKFLFQNIFLHFRKQLFFWSHKEKNNNRKACE